MVTAYASTKTAIRALSEGASAYIIKPLDMDEVLATVKQALENQCLVEEKRQAREALRKAHDELEQRVEERTAKLAKTTQQLKVELTERKQAEEALSLAHMELKKKAADLELANQELSEYNYIVAHVLKAPLRAIRNYADFLREDFRAILGGDQKAYFEGLDRAVAQGVELVEDLLEFSRVGRRSVPTQAIDVGIFLEELIASLALSPDVEVVMGNDWPTIDTEPTLLREIFQDLIRNAVKFNHASHKRVEIGWHPAGEERYELFVRDNGIGIDPRYHEQIFGVFQRLHTREEYEGTGVGLAIVKKATNKLHGSVRVESKIGEGSTFFVALPKTQRER
jgi:light-regulated signal transduction histidine kinase (bacteriophytochrome)